VQEGIVALVILVGHFVVSGVWAGRIARMRGASYGRWFRLGSGFVGVARASSYAGRDDPGSSGGGNGPSLA
jgi:hypothetical protein